MAFEQKVSLIYDGNIAIPNCFDREVRGIDIKKAIIDKYGQIMDVDIVGIGWLSDMDQDTYDAYINEK